MEEISKSFTCKEQNYESRLLKIPATKILLKQKYMHEYYQQNILSIKVKILLMLEITPVSVLTLY